VTERAGEHAEEHPDDILHRARVGLPLSARERMLRLEHLRACDVCRLLEETRVDLLDEAERPDRAGTSIAELIAATMATFEPTGAPQPGFRSRRLTGTGRARHATRTAAAVAAVLCAVAGAALAARWIVETRAARHVTPATPSRVTARGAGEQLHRPRGAPPTEVEPEGEQRAPPTQGPQGGAGELFARATEARRAGLVDDARRAYDRLWRQFPATEEAQAGRVAYGRWLLDLGQAGPAAAAFADYLQGHPRGTLAVEARVGLAEAMELLGDGPGARRAWQAVLDDPAAGALASHAKARLRSLDAGARGP